MIYHVTYFVLFKLNNDQCVLIYTYGIHLWQFLILGCSYFNNTLKIHKH